MRNKTPGLLLFYFSGCKYLPNFPKNQHGISTILFIPWELFQNFQIKRTRKTRSTGKLGELGLMGLMGLMGIP